MFSYNYYTVVCAIHSISHGRWYITSINRNSSQTGSRYLHIVTVTAELRHGAFVTAVKTQNSSRLSLFVSLAERSTSSCGNTVRVCLMLIKDFIQSLYILLRSFSFLITYFLYLSSTVWFDTSIQSNKQNELV